MHWYDWIGVGLGLVCVGAVVVLALLWREVKKRPMGF